MRVRTTARRATAALALGAMALGLTACDDPPTTVTTAVSFDCLVRSNNALVGDSSDTQSFSYAVTAPQAVAPAGTLELKVAPVPFSLDGNPTSDGTLTQISNLVWRVAIPTGTTVTSFAISGGQNLGAGTPSVTQAGSAIAVSVPGPLKAATSAAPNPITLPVLTLQLKDTAAAGSHLLAKMAGTSTSAPGVTYDARVTGTLLGTLDPSFSCFPNPSPTLHSTLVSTDVKAPQITIASPVAGQNIVQGARVLADYSCDDGTGVGVASCVGTVADGAPIDTATLGTRTFTVNAADKEGKTSVASVTYTVTGP